jgi:hypothetical protein
MVRGSTPQAATYVGTISALVICSEMIGVIVRNLVSCAYYETIIVVAFAICFQAYYLSSISVI